MGMYKRIASGLKGGLTPAAPDALPCIVTPRGAGEPDLGRSMKLYKYRDLTDPEHGLSLVGQIVSTKRFWCARPDTLNDPKEFAWICSYVLSPYTEELLADHVVRLKGRTKNLAQAIVSQAVARGRLRDIAEPVVESMIAQCRNSIGLACFGTSPDNDTLWDRYAGCGCGLCIELDAPDELLGSQLHSVHYWERKLLHIDTFLLSTSDPTAAAEVYRVSLLSKPLKWASEAEVRFVSKRQNVNVAIQGAHITRLIMGDAVPSAVRVAATQLARSIPIAERTYAVERIRKVLTSKST